MSEESPVYSGGSLDDFEDITEKLEALGVSYILMIGIPNQSVTRSWSNVTDFGATAKRNMESAFAEHMHKVEKLLEDKEES